MPARTGSEYLAGLRAQPREVWLAGERVEDVTTHPGIRRGAASVAKLYDMQHDPNEWHNLIGDKRYDAVIAEHRKWIPKNNAKPAPGSRSRILIYENGQANWETKDIGENDPIPEL